MSSLTGAMEDYEFSEAGGSAVSRSLLGTTTFKNQKLEEEAAIFFKDRQVNFSPPHPITHLIVCNQHLVLAMANKTLIRINLHQPDNLEEVDISKFALQAKIHKIFLDPTGQHLLISIISREGAPVDTLYLPQRTNKPKSTSKLKGHLITAVGWNRRNQSESMTGPILVGTGRGVILEIELTSDERFFQSGHEEYCKQVYDIGKETAVAITEIEVHSAPTDELQYMVMCTTLDKLYQFTGRVKSLEERPMFSSLFSNYLGLPPRFLELPSVWKSSWLQLYQAPGLVVPKHFAWMTEQGVYTGDINWSAGVQDDMTVNKKLNAYSDVTEDSAVPCGMILCEFHVLIVWPNRLRGLCILNSQVVFEGVIPDECGKLIGVSKDPIKGTIWVYAERGIFIYKVDREARNVWHIYLDQRNFKLAKKYCNSNPSQLSVVLLQEAQDLFQKKDYVNSAMLYAKTTASFEEVSLKFVEVEEEEALKMYLLEKFSSLKASEQTQLGVVLLWLVELYLKKGGTMRDAGRENTQEYRNNDEALKSLFSDAKIRVCLKNNSPAIFDLLSSHDDHENYVTLCIVLQDFDRVIGHLIRRERYAEALEILTSHGSEELFHKYVPALLQEIPASTIDGLISQGRRLDPIKLLPRLIHSHASHGNGSDMLRYIEYCVDKLEVTEPVLHNFLITLYAKETPERLLPYFKLQGDDCQSVRYDIKFALRECMSVGEERACVHILTTMGLYREAVELALKLDTALAKATANKPRYDQDLRKKLWLMIASHVVQEKQDMASAMEVIHECDLIKIEDILPFFPDFVTIDQFKDAICSSLQDYNQHIEDLKQEMDDAAKTAESIRKDIQKFKQKCSHVHAQDRCWECNYPLLTRAFYLFPCSHKFHQECLSDAVMGYLPEEKKNKLMELKGKLAAFSTEESGTGGIPSDKEHIRSEIDSLVASECLYCGNILVEHIDTPFISDSEWDSIMEEWQ